VWREANKVAAEHALRAEGLVPVQVLCDVTGLSRSIFQHMVAAGAFPKSVKISKARVAWRRRQVLAWLASVR
jgi:predicted DNA-binding transcriptional regulator AlpA